ncbi:unnamed protein product, partial [Rotaria sordida]
MDQDYPNLQEHLQLEIDNMRTTWDELKTMYENEIQRIRDFVMGARRGEIDQ